MGHVGERGLAGKVRWTTGAGARAGAAGKVRSPRSAPRTLQTRDPVGFRAQRPHAESLQSPGNAGPAEAGMCLQPCG